MRGLEFEMLSWVDRYVVCMYIDAWVGGRIEGMKVERKEEILHSATYLNQFTHLVCWILC